MDVLLVAPYIKDLPHIASEVEAIKNSGLNVDVVDHPVTKESILQEILRKKRGTIWFSSHGGEDGVMLDDEILSSSDLTGLVRGFELVFLNTCDSIKTAQMIQNQTNCAVICTIADIYDTTAYQTGALFAKYLSQTGDIVQSYKLALPGTNESFICLAGANVHFQHTPRMTEKYNANVGDEAENTTVGKGNSQSSNKQNLNINVETPRTPDKQLEDIRVALLGSEWDIDRPGLIRRVSKLETGMLEVKGEVQGIKNEVKGYGDRFTNIENGMINLTNAVQIRNDNRGKIQTTPWQLFILILVSAIILAIIIIVVAKFFPGGVINGSIGYSLFNLSHNRYIVDFCWSILSMAATDSI